MKPSIGIQQRRLSPRRDGKLQAFPHGDWQRELSVAARIGFDAIEWLYESERAEQNPISTAAGRAESRRVVTASGVAVRSVCASYFLVNRLTIRRSSTSSSTFSAASPNRCGRTWGFARARRASSWRSRCCVPRKTASEFKESDS